MVLDAAKADPKTQASDFSASNCNLLCRLYFGSYSQPHRCWIPGARAFLSDWSTFGVPSV